MLSKIIRNFIAKTVAGRTDDGIMITLSDPKKVDFQAAMLEDLLMRNGIDPRAITSEAQLKGILNQLKAIEKQSTTTSGIRNTESAKVFNIEGQSLDPNKPIIGGTQTGKELSPELSERLRGTNVDRIKQKIADKKIDDDLPPPGSRGGDDDIAAPVQSQEETMKNMMEAEIKEKLEKQNKDSVKRILERKNREDVYGLEDYDTTNMSEIKKEIIRTETKLGNLNPDSPDFREKAKTLSDRIIALKNKMRDDKADGGRIGLKGGADAATESFSKSAGSSRPGRKGSVSISPSGNVTFNPGGKDDGPVDKSTFEQTINQLRPPKKQPSGLEKIFDAGQEFNYLKNLAIGNFPGIGKQLLLDYGKRKLLDDQAMLDTEEEEDQNMMLADLTDMQKKMLEGPQKNLKDIMGISNEEILQNIEKFNNPDAPATIQDIEQFYQQARDGGIMRLGFKDGMNRRTFLKILGGAMSIPIIGKILKPFKVGKTVTKVPIIKTDNVAGKPEWFDQLVNKVILEGDDVTKRFATKDREIVHMKKIDEDNTVMVYQDLDEGAVRIDYDAPTNMGEDTVSLQYKKPLPDEGDPRPKAEFEASELEPRYVGGPEDADIEFDGLGGGSSIKMLESDVSKLKEYATGQKPTMKEFIESKKRKDAVNAINKDQMEQAEYIAGKYGDGPEPPDDIDFASGGIARMLGE